jgi:hypothetical protein
VAGRGVELAEGGMTRDERKKAYEEWLHVRLAYACELAYRADLGSREAFDECARILAAHPDWKNSIGAYLTFMHRQQGTVSTYVPGQWKAPNVVIT